MSGSSANLWGSYLQSVGESVVNFTFVDPAGWLRMAAQGLPVISLAQDIRCMVALLFLLNVFIMPTEYKNVTWLY